MKNNLREYKYSSVLIILVLIGVLSVLVKLILGDESDVADIINGLISMIGGYILASGLINTRMGSLGEYLSNINTINAKVIGVNLLLALIMVIPQIILALGAFMTVPSFSDKGSGVFAIIIVLSIVMVICLLFTAYTNYVLADNRFRNFGVMESIKLILSIGTKLLKETFILGLKYFGIPIALVIILLISTLNERLAVFAALASPILFILIPIYIFILPAFVARLSNLYLDYVEENYDNIDVNRNEI